MIKSLFKYFLFFLITAIIALIYLSYFGVETNKFNQLIKNEISKNNEKISIELQKVKIVLDIFNFSIKLKTFDPILVANKKKIELKKLETNFSIGSFVQKRFAIENVLISTKENNIKEIIDLAIVFQNSPQLYILGKMLKGGTLIANINLNFDDSGHIKNNYNIEGSIVNAELKLLNKRNIDKINFNFKIKNKFFNFDKTNLIFENLKLASKNIKIENKENYYSVEGDVRNSEEAISSELISTYLNSNFKDIGFKELNLSSENKFYFRINKKLKISNVNINSKVNLKELVYESNKIKFEEYLPNFDGKIKFSDHNIEIDYLKNDLSIKGKGNLILKKEIDKIKYEISFKNKKYDFISEIFLDNNSIYVDFLNYKKKEKKASSLVIEGRYDKNDFLYLKRISFKEKDNQFSINELDLNKNYKINDFNSIQLNLLNTNNINNQIYLKKNKNNYEIKGKIFDASFLIDKALNSDSKKSIFSSLFNDLNTKIIININKTYIDKLNYLSQLNGNLTISNNDISNLEINSDFPNKKKLSFTIKTNELNEKITTLFTDEAKPLVDQYKFIKGFKDGSLDFYSIKKNDTSKSTLKIYDFKLNELPALTKILTLASLQGVADLLTGEGIRFNEFEMQFTNKNQLMTIDEIYAIGPAISILMEGYIESDKLVSLRGTLVPATTLNKVIGSIPFLGNILVGKKTGEGVFGVSFKIKGPPKDLKTSVNPIKTLTPRFITRTLEKIKQN